MCLSVSEGMEGGWVDGLANSVRRCSFLDVVLNSVNMPGLLGWYFVFVVCGFPSRCLVFWTVYSLLWIYARPVGSVTRVFGPMFDWLDGFYGAIKMALFNFGDMAD